MSIQRNKNVPPATKLSEDRALFKRNKVQATRLAGEARKAEVAGTYMPDGSVHLVAPGDSETPVADVDVSTDTCTDPNTGGSNTPPANPFINVLQNSFATTQPLAGSTVWASDEANLFGTVVSGSHMPDLTASSVIITGVTNVSQSWDIEPTVSADGRSVSGTVGPLSVLDPITNTQTNSSYIIQITFETTDGFASGTTTLTVY